MATIESTIELVTAKRGEPHVTSNQAGMLNAGMAGEGAQVFSGILGGLAITISSDMTEASLTNGCALIDGRELILPAACTIDLQGGAVGEKRHDLVCARYDADEEGIESVSVEYIVGTPDASTPADPETNEGSILGGDSPVDFKLYRLVWDGLNCTPVKLFSERESMASLTEDNGQNALVGGDGAIRRIPRIVELWANENPENEYDNGTPNADASGYDLVVITFASRLTTTSDKTEPLTMVIPSNRFNKTEQALAWNYGASQSASTWVACRYITVNTNSTPKNITVAACNWKYAGGGTGGASSATKNHLIPQHIYGVKLG